MLGWVRWEISAASPRRDVKWNRHEEGFPLHRGVVRPQRFGAGEGRASSGALPLRQRSARFPQASSPLRGFRQLRGGGSYGHAGEHDLPGGVRLSGAQDRHVAGQLHQPEGLGSENWIACRSSNFGGFNLARTWGCEVG